MLKWVLASNNKHKVEEIMAILSPLGITLLTMADVGLKDLDIEENGDTFEANALIKARAVHALTGMPTLADDSGLAVNCLEGAPGVYSARFAGEPKSDTRNNAKLLEALTGYQTEARKAHFVCVLAFVSDTESYTLRGEAHGYILEAERGNHGFGYDPLFFSIEAQKSFAELSAHEKNTISHRAKALKLLEKKVIGGAQQ